jgi:hypothetical protein
MVIGKAPVVQVVIPTVRTVETEVGTTGVVGQETAFRVGVQVLECQQDMTFITS